MFALALLLFHFLKEFAYFASGITQATERDVILGVLGMIDLAFTGNLILIVIFSGYENFVSKINVEEHDRPDWMTKVDFGGLKQKLMTSIVAISAVELLKGFHEYREVRSDTAGLARRNPCGLSVVVARGRARGSAERADEASSELAKKRGKLK